MSGGFPQPTLIVLTAFYPPLLHRGTYVLCALIMLFAISNAVGSFTFAGGSSSAASQSSAADKFRVTQNTPNKRAVHPLGAGGPTSGGGGGGGGGGRTSLKPTDSSQVVVVTSQRSMRS